MNRKINIINNVISLLLTVVASGALVFVCNSKYQIEMVPAMLYLLLGVVVSGLLVTFIHELCHLVSGKRRGFGFVSLTVWFFRWQKVGDKIRFSFVMMGDAVGETVMVAKNTENLAKRVYAMTMTPAIFTAIFTLVGLAPVFLTKYIPLPVYIVIGSFLPVGVYSLLGNFLPMSSEGINNDGALMWNLNKNTDQSKVVLSLISIQSELYNGKTPSEVDKSLYFDIPQLREDDINFISLLNARYAYYLDADDFDNAKKTTERLLSLEDYMPKYFAYVIKTDALYNACTFDFNEDKADEYTYELEKFLNRINTSENIRAKLAYLLYAKKEKDGLDEFYNRGIREANRNPVKGLGLYEKKLLAKMKDDILAD